LKTIGVKEAGFKEMRRYRGGEEGLLIHVMAISIESFLEPPDFSALMYEDVVHFNRDQSTAHSRTS
jgi:hypothetical protein